MRKLRYQEAKSLVQGNKPSMCWSWESNPSNLTSRGWPPLYFLLTIKAITKTQDWESDNLSFILSLSLIRCVNLGKSLYFSEPQFTYRANDNNNIVYYTRLL